MIAQQIIFSEAALYLILGLSPNSPVVFFVEDTTKRTGVPMHLHLFFIFLIDMFNKELFSKMKPNAIFVNVSR